MYDQDGGIPHEENEQHDNPQEAALYQPLVFNPEPYFKYLVEADVPEDQKRELLETVWNIVVMFIDAGFKIAPKATVKNLAENKTPQLASRFSDVVKSEPDTQNNQTTTRRPAPKNRP